MNRTARGRVLVLDGARAASVVCVRSLARAGCLVDVAESAERPLASASRFCAQAFVYPDPMTNPEDFVDWIKTHTTQISYDLIIPMTDETLLPLSEGRDRLSATVRVALPPLEALAIFVDKARTVELARRLNVSVPGSLHCRTVEDIEAAAMAFGLPMALKPSRSVAQIGNESRESLAVCYLFTCEECRTHGDRLLKYGPVVAQEYVRGGGVGVEMLCDNGEPILVFQHERLHEMPLSGGGSSLRRSVSVDVNLLKQASSLMREVKWHGVAMAEFKVDRVTGKTWLMEVNGRFWGSLPLAVAAGADFPTALYELLVEGRQVAAANIVIGIIGRSFSRDMKWLTSVLLQSDSNPLIRWPSRASALGSWLNILSPKHRFDLQCISDPKPGLIEIKQTLLDFGRKISQRFLRVLIIRDARRLALKTTKHRAQLLRRANRLLFICRGNINRSLLAEAYLRSIVELSENQKITSAGFHPREGRPGDPITVCLAREIGLDMSDLRSRTISDEFVDDSDLIIVMELEQATRLVRLYPQARPKVVMLAALAGISDEIEITDPYGEGEETYRKVFAQVRYAVGRIATLWGKPAASRADTTDQFV